MRLLSLSSDDVMLDGDKPRQKELLGYMNALLDEELDAQQDLSQITVQESEQLEADVKKSDEGLISNEPQTLLVKTDVHERPETKHPTALLKPPPELEDKLEESKVPSFMATPARTWAQGKFDALLIKIAGVTVAVPLFQVQKIHKINKPLVRLADRPDWFLGLYSYSGRTIQVLDIRQLISVKSNNVRNDWLSGHIIEFESGLYGFACEEVDKIIKLENKDVRWRNNEKDKAWYMGIIAHQMCIFVDMQQLLTEKIGPAMTKC